MTPLNGLSPTSSDTMSDQIKQFGLETAISEDFHIPQGMKMVLHDGVPELNINGTVKLVPITRTDYETLDNDFVIPAGKKILVQVGSIRPDLDQLGRIQFEDE